MHTSQILPAEEVAEIAATYGFESDDPEVIEEVEDARKRHGQPVQGYNGDQRLYWHVNPRTGLVDAALLLAGNLQEQARVRNADCGSIGSFHEAAYGDD